MGALSRQLLRFVLLLAIAIFVVVTLVALAAPPASATDGGETPLLGVHRGHCNDEGYVNGEMPTGDPGTQSVTPASTRTPVPIESEGKTCWLALVAAFLGIPAMVGLLGRRLL